MALPRLTRFVSGPTIATELEVDVPPLAADARIGGGDAGAQAHAVEPRPSRSRSRRKSGHFQAAGLPTIVCGPGSIDQAHKPDEFVEEAQLAACLAFLDNLARELSR